MQSTEDLKKEYLRQYMPCVIAEKESEQNLNLLESEIKDFLQHIDLNLLKSYFDKLTQVRQMLMQFRYKKWFLYAEIYEKIENMGNETEKRVLRLKYLYGYSWERVSDEMGYSIRQTHNIHRKALANLKL